MFCTTAPCNTHAMPCQTQLNENLQFMRSGIVVDWYFSLFLHIGLHFEWKNDYAIQQNFLLPLFLHLVIVFSVGLSRYQTNEKRKLHHHHMTSLQIQSILIESPFYSVYIFFFLFFLFCAVSFLTTTCIAG